MMKKVIIPVIAIMAVVFLVAGCKPIKHRPQASGKTSHSGKTPDKAIHMKPVQSQKRISGLAITVNDNIRWLKFYGKKGKRYTFETSGTGDPLLCVYKKSQVDKSGTINGDPLERDNDGAPDNNNAMLSFRPQKTGHYYLKLMLYAGRSWQGQVLYSQK